MFWKYLPLMDCIEKDGTPPYKKRKEKD